MKRITEKQKFYVLIVMVCIAGVIGYFRFWGGSESTEKHHLVSKPPDQQVATRSDNRIKKQKGDGPMTMKGPARRPLLRDIFKPAGPLPSTVAPTPVEKDTAPADISLSGTLIGGDRSMAIINNQFMRPGQKVGRYKITRITPDKVYLAAGKDRRCLRVVTATEAITE